MKQTFQHPDISPIEGVMSDGVFQFLGLQYATLDDRFAPPVLKEYVKTAEKVVDGTRMG